MPTLSLLPSPAGPSPEGNSVRANEGTEGREGANSATTNGGGDKETWTRLLQSFIQQNQVPKGASSKTTVSALPEKSKPLNKQSDTKSPNATAVGAMPATATVVPAATPLPVTLTATSLPLAPTPQTTDITPPKAPTISAAVPASYTADGIGANGSPQTGQALVRPLNAESYSSSTNPTSATPLAAVLTPASTQVNPNLASLTVPIVSAEAVSIVVPTPYTLGVSAKPASTKTSTNESVKANMERTSILGQSDDSPVKVVSPIAPSILKANVDQIAAAQGKETNKGDTSSGQGSAIGISPTSSQPTAAVSTTVPQTQIITSSHAERLAVVDQISQHIQSQQSLSANPNTVTVRIQPPQWGDVKITVTLDPAAAGSTDKSTISATITTANADVQGVLQGHAQDLKNSLTTAGITLDKLNVGVGTVAAMASSGGSTGHHAGQQREQTTSGQTLQMTANDSSPGSGSGGAFQSPSSFSGSGDDSPNSLTELSSPAQPAPINIPAATVSSSGVVRIDMKA
jgi:hypothetical protein